MATNGMENGNMRIFGMVGEDGGGFFVKATPASSFEEFVKTMSQPGAVLDGCNFVPTDGDPAVWEPVDETDQFFASLRTTNIKFLSELQALTEANILRIFEYEVPDDTYFLDWGGGDEADPPGAYPKEWGYRPFTGSCTLAKSTTITFDDE